MLLIKPFGQERCNSLVSNFLTWHVEFWTEISLTPYWYMYTHRSLSTRGIWPEPTANGPDIASRCIGFWLKNEVHGIGFNVRYWQWRSSFIIDRWAHTSVLILGFMPTILLVLLLNPCPLVSLWVSRDATKPAKCSVIGFRLLYRHRSISMIKKNFDAVVVPLMAPDQKRKAYPNSGCYNVLASLFPFLVPLPCSVKRLSVQACLKAEGI